MTLHRSCYGFAGVAQWQSPSLPSWPCRFDPGHPLRRSPGFLFAPFRSRAVHVPSSVPLVANYPHLLGSGRASVRRRNEPPPY
jgi:hypothetical protein